MKLYKCDICGKLIDPDKVLICKLCYRQAGLQGVLSQDKDVCETCLAIGSELDFDKIMVDAWRKAVNEMQAR